MGYWTGKFIVFIIRYFRFFPFSPFMPSQTNDAQIKDQYSFFDLENQLEKIYQINNFPSQHRATDGW